MVSTFSTLKSIPKTAGLRLVAQGLGTGKYDSGSLGGKKKGVGLGVQGLGCGFGAEGRLKKMKIELERPI